MRQWFQRGVCALCLLGLGRMAGAAAPVYRNVVNTRFATVSNGPQNAAIVDVADPSDRRAVAAAVTRALSAQSAQAPASLLAAQYAFLRGHPPFRHGAGRLAPPAFDDVVLLRSHGQIVQAFAGTVRALALTAGDLSFAFDGWTSVELGPLQTFTSQAYAAAKAVYGSPSSSATIRIVKDGNVLSALRNGGGYYNASTNEIHLYPSADYLTHRQDVHLNLLHLMLHAFHGTAQFQYDAWEEGFARAATIAALGFIDNAAEVAKTGPEITLHSDYYLMQLYETLNQPALGSNRFLSGSGWDGMLLWRNAMATAAWLKVYTEKRDFFLQFNQAYYARFTADLAGNVPALKSLAAQVLGDQIEGRTFADWYRRQYVLDTSVTPGEKLFVYNAPVFPTQTSPPSQSGWSQAAILEFYRTDGSSGRETPLNGTCYPAAWGFDYNQELPLEPQDRIVNLVNGQGTVIPTFFNIGQTTAQRLTIDYTVDQETVRTFLPVAFTDVDPNWSDFLGVCLGANTGSVSVKMQDGSSANLTVIQGGFGGRLAAGSLPAFSRTTLSYTGAGSAQPVTQQVNTGFDYYLAIVPVGAATPGTVAHTIAAGVHMLAAPVTPFLHDPAGNFGVPANRLLLTRWDATLASANRYATFPLSPPWRPGRGFWTKLDADRTLAIDGTAPVPDADAPIGLPYGWNQIGNPWFQPVDTSAIRVQYLDGDLVSFSTAVSNGWIQQGLWRFVPGTGYQNTTTLPPWEAEWIRVNVAEGLTLYVAPPGVTSQRISDFGFRISDFGRPGARTPSLTAGPKSEIRNPKSEIVPGWRLDLSAASGSGRSSVTIGQAPGASDAFDRGLDIERPPSARSLGIVPGAELAALPALTPPGTTSDGFSGLAVDLHAPGSTQPWLIELRTSRPGTSTEIRLDPQGTVPPGLTFRDVGSGRVFSADGTHALTLRTDGNGVARVLVTPTAPRALPSVTGLAVTGMANGRVQLIFTTSDLAQVEARISDRLGMPVRLLFQGLLPAGPHALEWDGRRDSGALAPSGLYRLVITARIPGGPPVRADLPIRFHR